MLIASELEFTGMPFVSLECVRLPSYEKDFSIVAHLFCYCDESGKEHSHNIIVFNSLVAGNQQWEVVSASWMELLRRYQLNSFHAKDALRHSQPYGTMKPGTAEQRAEDILPFARTIVEGIGLGVIGAIDVRAFKLPTLHRLRLNIDDDPHYFAFFLVISLIMGYWRVPRDYTMGLILDDEERKSMPVHKLLIRMKKESEEVKQRIPSLCFMDDSIAPQLQAVDLFTYLSRLEAERIFLDKPHPYAMLVKVFNTPATGRERLDIIGGYFGEERLREFMESRTSRK